VTDEDTGTEEPPRDEPTAEEHIVSQLMISVSGVRGILGDGLTPEVALHFAQAFGTYAGEGSIVVGRDSRVTGELIQHAVVAGLAAVGCDVVDVGICPTPTIQLATERWKAKGGIAITASHNPIPWNGLKLIGPDGLFLDADEGNKVRKLVEEKAFHFASWDRIGKIQQSHRAIDEHIEAILKLPFIDVAAIQKRRFKVVVDCVNGAGANLVPKLLHQLGCEVIPLYCEPTGHFPHTPEPLPENLTELTERVKTEKADVGFAVDPDSDRCAVVSERGEPLGEEYTLALAVKFVLSKRRGPVVVNASTTQAIEEIARPLGLPVIRTKVGEVHVAQKMREVGAVIGGEGNGGVILPEVHLGRDAPVAIALTLQHLAEFGGSLFELYRAMPQYTMARAKVELQKVNPQAVLEALKRRYARERLDFTDGVKILWDEAWVHIRPSNTEPIVRVLAEAKTRQEARELCEKFVREVNQLR